MDSEDVLLLFNKYFGGVKYYEDALMGLCEPLKIITLELLSDFNPCVVDCFFDYDGVFNLVVYFNNLDDLVGAREYLVSNGVKVRGKSNWGKFTVELIP